MGSSSDFKTLSMTASIFLLMVLLMAISAESRPKNQLIILNEENWDQLLTGEWMVEFYAPWCPACKQLEPQWNTFSSWSDDLSIKIAAVDVTLNPGLSGRFMVTALPTIYHVKEGIFRQYRGARDTNSFVSFVEDKKWEALEPISNWKAPNSYQMSLVSYFFKISMALRSVHNRLVEDYGIPYWGSYVLFAFATIILGALLGLLIVCMIDLLFPAKNPYAETNRDRETNYRNSSEPSDGKDAGDSHDNPLTNRRKKEEEDENDENRPESKKDS